MSVFSLFCGAITLFLWHIADRRRGGRGRFIQARDDVQVGHEQLGNVDGVYLRVRDIEDSLYAGGPGDVGDATITLLSVKWFGLFFDSNISGNVFWKLS